MAESISYIKVGNQNHPIDAVTVNGLSFTSDEKTRWNNKQDALTFDSIPTENSDNLVKSGSLYTVLTDTELVVATALNDLNERILSVDSSISEVYDEIDRALTAVLTYRGTVGSNGDVSVLPSSHEVGDVYVVSVAGTYAGQSCEVGDYIICKTSGTSASDAHWNVVNGENQVSNSAASLAAPGSSVTIATIDGTNITISTPSTWTGVSKNGTLTGVKFNGTSASISNGVASISVSIPSEVTEATVSGWGFTKNTGTLTTHASHKLTTTNNAATAVNQGTEITFVESLTGTTTATSGDLTVTATRKKVTIPTAVTEATVSGWGFTKNTGTLTTHASHKLTATNNTATAVNQGTEITFIESLTGTTTATSGDLTVTATRKKVTIPTAVTEATVSGWGFTKNSGTLTGVTLNGVSASVSNGVASLSLTFDSIPTENSDNLVKSGVLYKVITDNEYVAAAAINDLNDRLEDANSSISSLESSISAMNSVLVFDSIPTENSENLVNSGDLYDVIVSNERVVATAFNDVNDRLMVLENTFSGAITGITVNGSSVAVSDGIASISISGGTGGGITGVTFNGVSASISNGVAAISASIPSAVTEATVSGWGFTKNTGTLTTHASHKLTTTNSTATSVNQGTEITFIESLTGTTTATSGDLTVTATRKKVTIPTAVTESTVTGWGFTKNAGTLTGISMNSAAVSVSNGVANLGTVLTSHQSIKTINSQTMTGSGNVTIREIPACTSSDNGKVLQVVNGSWTLVTPVSIYSGSSNPDNSQGTNGDLYLQTS